MCPGSARRCAQDLLTSGFVFYVGSGLTVLCGCAQVDVGLSDGSYARGAVPSGVSTVETKSCLSQGRISSPSLSNARAHHQGLGKRGMKLILGVSYNALNKYLPPECFDLSKTPFISSKASKKKLFPSNLRRRSSSCLFRSRAGSTIVMLATGTGIAPFCLFLWNMFFEKHDHYKILQPIRVLEEEILQDMHSRLDPSTHIFVFCFRIVLVQENYTKMRLHIQWMRVTELLIPTHLHLEASDEPDQCEMYEDDSKSSSTPQMHTNSKASSQRYKSSRTDDE
uniref:Uncharacterized protein n=1 Tax=Zea mays TaxID=4577 RepID=A0A804PYD9_MAIZE